MSYNAVVGFGQGVLNTASQLSFVQALGKNWIQSMPENPAEGQTWNKQGDNHYHQPTKQVYRAESNDWAVAKTMAIVFGAGSYCAIFACVRHIGTTVYETAKGVHSVYTDWQAYKVAQAADPEHTPKEELKGFVKNRLLGTKDAQSVFIPAIKEGKQALKDYAMWNLFALNTLFVCNTLLGYNLMANYTFLHLLPSFASYLPATIIAYSLYAPLEPRVYLEKLQDWWRPEGIKPLTDREVSKMSVWGTVKHLTESNITPFFKTGREAPAEVAAVVVASTSATGQVEESKKDK